MTPEILNQLLKNVVLHSPEFNQQLVEVVRWVLQRNMDELKAPVTQAHTARERTFVKLSEDLPATSTVEASRSDISSAEANYLWFANPQNWDETPEEGTKSVRVYNLQDATIDEGTIGYIEVIMGLPFFIIPGEGGSGGPIIWVRITDTICPDEVNYDEPQDGFVGELVATAGGSSPSPQRDDGGYLIQDPFGMAGSYKETETTSVNAFGSNVYAKATLGDLVDDGEIGTQSNVWIMDWIRVIPDCTQTLL